MSEKHKAYVLVVAVIIAALVAYVRFFRDRPPSTGTQPPAAADTGTTPFADRQLSTPQKQRVTHGFGSPAYSQIRNLFAPQGLSPDVLLKPAGPSVTQPTQTLELSGTVLGGNTALAIINDQFIRQGQTIGGYRVAKIMPDRVHLIFGEHEKILDVMPQDKGVR